MLLNQNERHGPLPGDIVAEIHAAWAQLELHRYDEAVTDALREDLARHYGFPMEDIIITNGGDGAIEIITTGAARRVEQALIPTPNFSVYDWAARKAQLPIRKVPITLEEGSLPVADLLAAADRPSLVFLCRPHNPVGDVPPVEQVEELAASLPAGSLIMVDEAYIEYGGDPLTEWMAGRSDVALLRTFSKALGLAGLRCGYGVIPEPWRQLSLDATPPFAVANAALAAARVVLRHLPRLEAEAQEIARRREEVFQRLEAVEGIRPFPSQGNFILFRVQGGPVAAAALAAALARQEIFVRTYDDDPIINDCLRVSIGTSDEMEAFVAALTEAAPAALGEGMGL